MATGTDMDDTLIEPAFNYSSCDHLYPAAAADSAEWSLSSSPEEATTEEAEDSDDSQIMPFEPSSPKLGAVGGMDREEGDSDDEEDEENGVKVKAAWRRAKATSPLFLGPFHMRPMGHRPLQRTSYEYLYIPQCRYEPVGEHIPNEALYRGLMRCLVHPVGARDPNAALQPGNLLDHLREVFALDRDDHAYLIQDELHSKPRRCQANVTIAEARDVKVIGHPQDAGPYCLVSAVHPHTVLEGGFPQVFPQGLPPFLPPHLPQDASRSPAACRSLDSPDVLRTQSSPNVKNPVWNEEFQLDIDEPLTDEIHVCLCFQDDPSVSDTRHDKGHVLKNFFRNIVQMAVEPNNMVAGCLGRVIIPISEIAGHGSEAWYTVHPVGLLSCKSRSMGQIRLHLSLTHRQDGLGSNNLSVEDYHQAALVFYKHSAKAAMESESNFVLSPQSRRILDLFAVSIGISKLSQAIMDLTVLLEMVASEEKYGLTDSHLHSALEDVQMTWSLMSVGQLDHQQRMPLSDTEIYLYQSASRTFINSLSAKIDDLPPLFPPSADSLAVLKNRLGLAIHLLELELWDAGSCPRKDLAQKLLDKLQDDIRQWMRNNLGSIHCHGVVKDTVIPEINSLVEVIHSVTSHCCPLGVVRKFYSSLGVNYYRLVAFETEKQVSAKVRELMLEMDKYQARYHNFPVNVSTSSRLTLRLYFTLGRFAQIVKDNVTDRDSFRLLVCQFQDWFKESMVFWLQTFRSECVYRIEKALEIDKDLVLVTSLVKFSNSSVDVLSCFSKITEEWRLVDFKDPDSCLMGVTKITDLICDGARLYAERIQCLLERNCYYDTAQEQFDVTDRLCITLNNIEHTRQYLNELPQLLKWEDVMSRVVALHEESRIGEQARSTLHRLVSTAHQDILLKSSFLLREIAEKMRPDLQKFMQIFIVRSPEKNSSVDQTVMYLNNNLQILHDRLMSSIYPQMIRELWAVVVHIFDAQMGVGKTPEYYGHMSRHLRALCHFFTSCGLGEEELSTPGYAALSLRLEENCLSTEDLMLQYFYCLGNSMSTPVDYFGHLAVKVGHVEETRGNVTIYVKVLRACDLPGLDASGLSDPYVVLSLQPPTMFGNFKPQRTQVVEQNLHPVFNATFQMPCIPREFLSREGTVLLMSVMDRDRLRSDDFAGEVILHLSGIPRVERLEEVDRLPVVMMPLKRPTPEVSGPLQVLQERQSWDKAAKNFVAQRTRVIENQPERTDRERGSRLGNLFSFFGFQSSTDT